MKRGNSLVIFGILFATFLKTQERIFSTKHKDFDNFHHKLKLDNFSKSADFKRKLQNSQRTNSSKKAKRLLIHNNLKKGKVNRNKKNKNGHKLNNIFSKNQRKLNLQSSPEKEEISFKPTKPPKVHPRKLEAPEAPEVDMPDPAEMLLKAIGMGSKGNKISTMTGGNMHVILGKEGSPIYIDQSPSYIYHNPKSEYNQNGIRMPLSANSEIATMPNSQQLISTNFIRPRRLNAQKAIVVSDNNGFETSGRELRSIKFRNSVPMQQSGIVASPEGPLVQSTLQDVYPENPIFSNEGENQFSETIDSSKLFERALGLINSVKGEIEGVENTMRQNNDKIDSIINRFFDIKFS